MQSVSSLVPASRMSSCSLRLQNGARRPAVAFRAMPTRLNSRRLVRVQATAGDEQGPKKEDFALAPSKPTSPMGEMAAYYLQMQPHLFRETVEGQFQKLKEQREAETSSSDNENQQQPSDATDLVLFKRMAEVRRQEQMLAIEDLMYVCILEKFQLLGVDMLPRLEPIEESLEALKALTEGVHSREALQMVKEHVLSVLGPASMAYSSTKVKMSKLQAAQVYVASIMFGYFLRRVDGRFQLAKTMGMLPENPDDAVERLERLFAMAAEVEESDDPDSAPIPDPSTLDEAASTTTAASSSAPEPEPTTTDSTGLVRQKRGGALRDYVESFDQDTMLQIARLVTAEGAGLVERQTSALFGDVKALQSEMAEAVGQDSSSMEEIMQRVQQAVTNDTVQNVVMTVATQRRAVLEAVAYGCFLRDVESWVDTDYQLLTPTSVVQ